MKGIEKGKKELEKQVQRGMNGENGTGIEGIKTRERKKEEIKRPRDERK